MSKSDFKTIGLEVGKTVAGFILGRVAVNMGKKALKVADEMDAKKKKMKEVGVGAGVSAIGLYAATSVCDEYKSIAAGVSAAGAISALSPFGKEDKGFIPVLNGTVGTTEEYDYTERFDSDDEDPSDFEDFEDVESDEQEETDGEVSGYGKEIGSLQIEVG